MLEETGNPYESPSHCPRTKSAPIPFLERMCWGTLGGALGGFAGMLAGLFLWNFFYGIGNSVITDEMYAAYESDVGHWSGVLGTVTGALIGCIFARRTLRILVTQHGVGIVAGMICAYWGWQCGVAGYLAGQVAGVIVAAAHRSRFTQGFRA